MRIRVLRGALALVFLGVSSVQMPALAGGDDATDKAVMWFRQKKSPDGALPSYENGYTVGGTADGILALAAAGQNIRRFGRRAGDTPLEYLQAHAADDTDANDPRDDAHLAGKVALAVKIAGKDPYDFGGADLVGFIRDRYESSTGGYRGAFTNFEVQPFGQALALLGLISSGEQVPPKAVDYLIGSQKSDGGWDSSGYGTDTTTSSMAVQALVAAKNQFGRPGDLDAAVKRSIPFFQGEQNEDGGFSNQKEFAGNFCSGTRPSEVDATGFAIQAIRAAGQDPAQRPWTSEKGLEPGEFLRSVQHTDGSFAFQEGPDCKGNGGSTYAAILGLEEASYVCLMDLGTCPPNDAFETRPGASGTATDAPPPGFDQLDAAPQAAAVEETPGGAQPAGGPPRRLSRPARPPNKATPVEQASQPCGAPACPVAAASSPAASSISRPAPPSSAPGAKERPSAAGRRVSRENKSGPNFIVWAGVAIVVGLCVSIVRQWRRGRP